MSSASAASHLCQREIESSASNQAGLTLQSCSRPQQNRERVGAPSGGLRSASAKALPFPRAAVLLSGIQPDCSAERKCVPARGRSGRRTD